MRTFDRFKSLSTTILVLVVGISLSYKEVGLDITNLGQPFDTIILTVLSVLSFETITSIVYYVSENNNSIKKVYWGKSYLDGIWYYTSQDDQGGNNLGIYRISQDLFYTKLVAFRLGPQFQKVSTVNSVSDFIRIDNHFKIICRRTDWDVSRKEYFSKVILNPDEAVKHGFFKYPNTMRGEVMIFGGEMNGLLSGNVVWKKLENCDTEGDAIDYLKTLFINDSSKTWQPLP